MLIHGFPPKWSAVKKLIWLKGAGIVGAAKGVWKTVTGTLIHITNALASPMQKCEVSLEPIQDLHGQDAPYPAGGGKNKFDKDVLDSPSDYSNYYNSYIYSNPIFLKPNTTYTISPTSTDKLGVSDYYVLYINRNETDPNAIENPTGSVSFLYPVSAGKPTVITFTTGATGVIRFGVITVSTQQAKETALAAFMTIDYQVEEGSTATPWTPYENICPITGWTGCEVWVKDEYDTSLPATASVTFPDTVYGGKYDFVSGGLKPYKEYDSYNCETLTGEWMSSMDKYVAGTTPTIGAQVVDLDGYDTTVQLTPQEISTLKGVNNVWSNSNGETTIIYKAQAE